MNTSSVKPLHESENSVSTSQEHNKPILQLKNVNDDVIAALLDWSEYRDKLDQEYNIQLDEKQKRRFNNLIIEIGENTYRHGLKNIDTLDVPSSEKDITPLELGVEDDTITITTENFFETGKEGDLKNNLEKVNNMSYEEIKESYDKQLDNSEFWEAWWAGLWFMKIAKIIKTIAKNFGRIFEANVQRINDKVSKLILVTRFPLKTA